MDVGVAPPFSPTCPCELYPQHFRSPLSRMAQVWIVRQPTPQQPVRPVPRSDRSWLECLVGVASTIAQLSVSRQSPTLQITVVENYACVGGSVDMATAVRPLYRGQSQWLKDIFDSSVIRTYRSTIAQLSHGFRSPTLHRSPLSRMAQIENAST